MEGGLGVVSLEVDVCDPLVVAAGEVERRRLDCSLVPVLARVREDVCNVRAGVSILGTRTNGEQDANIPCREA